MSSRETPFSAIVEKAFSIAGRGTVILLEEGWTGRVKIGDRLLVPLDEGAVEMVVRAVEVADGKRDGKPWSRVGLLFEEEFDHRLVRVGAVVRVVR